MMTSLNDDLLAALGTAHADPGYQPSPSSPEASAMLARILSQQPQDPRSGRGAPVRRNALRAVSALAVAAAGIALVPIFARAPSPVRPAARPGPAHHLGVGAANVRLVAYTGARHTFYEVQKIPAGWVIQGTIPEDLVIAPANDPDKDPNSFAGKLFVGMQLIGGPEGQRVSVNGHVAWYRANAGGDTQMLQFKYIHGWWLIVQSPPGLRWTMDQMISFAAGVTVLPGARPGAG